MHLNAAAAAWMQYNWRSFDQNTDLEDTETSQMYRESYLKNILFVQLKKGGGKFQVERDIFIFFVQWILCFKKLNYHKSIIMYNPRPVILVC